MEFSTMTVEEIITWLYEKMCNHEKITIDMLKEIVSECSVTDTIASEGAVTIFYSEMEIEAAVSTADIGSIKEGNSVAVKVSAYPYTEYGLIDGELIYIADAAVGDGNGNYTYQVRVKIISEDLKERKINLSTGMTAGIEIKTGRRSIMNYFLEPLKKGVHNSMKEQ